MPPFMAKEGACIFVFDDKYIKISERKKKRKKRLKGYIRRKQKKHALVKGAKNV